MLSPKYFKDNLRSLPNLLSSKMRDYANNANKVETIPIQYKHSTFILLNNYRKKTSQIFCL